MKAFCYGVLLQWKLDLRNRGVLLTYYAVPLVFFAFMGGVFTSIDPSAKETLIQSMTVFGVSMGALIGAPHSLVGFYAGGIKKAYQAGGIPLWTPVINNLISAFFHLLIMSIMIFFLAPPLFGAKQPEHLDVYFISIALLVLASIALSTILGVFVKSTGKLSMLSQIFFLPSIILSGIMFPVEMLPKALSLLGKAFPAAWAYLLMQEDFVTLSGVLPLLIITGIAAAIVIFRLFAMQKGKTAVKRAKNN